MTENTLEKTIDAGLAEFDEKFPNALYEVKNFGTEDYKYVDDELKDFIRTLSLTIAQATHDAVSVEEEEVPERFEGATHEQKVQRYKNMGSNAAKKEMHERFTRFISK